MNDLKIEVVVAECPTRLIPVRLVAVVGEGAVDARGCLVREPVCWGLGCRLAAVDPFAGGLPAVTRAGLGAR